MRVQEIEDGFEESLASRSPFVVRGAARDWPARAWKLEQFDASVDPANPMQYWYHLPPECSDSDELPRPAWLTAHWRGREETLSLERPIRFWQSPGGHRTPWHYDGNALDVVNVQLAGSKQFSLAPPERELPWVRFMPISTLAYEDPPVPTLEVTLHAGDLIFIPRFWGHRVYALESANRNVNWVWTDSAFAPDSAVAVREAERLAAVRKLEDSGRLENVLTGYEAEGLRYELQSYGGCQNENLVARMLETVTPERVDARIDVELANESSDDFIARLDPRARSLFTRELFGHTSYADELAAEAAASPV